MHQQKVKEVLRTSYDVNLNIHQKPLSMGSSTNVQKEKYQESSQWVWHILIQTNRVYVPWKWNVNSSPVITEQYAT